tara:strand:- start:258 stop:992 length:735 start_codon:yes stop_codon:yes gene_type:complete
MLATRSVLRGASRAQQLLQRSSSSIALPGVPRRLADVAKLELLEAEQPAALAAIWEKYHENRPELSGSCVPAAEHAQIVERGRESPLFIFPVRREQGHFMLLSQFDVQHSVFVMTFLEDYKRNPAAAQPWLSVTLFDELMASKGLGLLRVEVRASSPSRSLSVAVLLTDRRASWQAVPERLAKAEAAHIMSLVRRYYGTDDYDRVWSFNHVRYQSCARPGRLGWRRQADVVRASLRRRPNDTSI